jgi:esterase/lipase superfamily enzyme
MGGFLYTVLLAALKLSSIQCWMSRSSAVTLRVNFAGFKTLQRTVTLPSERIILPLEGGEVTQTVVLSSAAGKPNRALVTVYYATDRQRSGSSDPYLFYTGLRNPEPILSYGTCRVHIPPDHRFGELEEPSLIYLEFRPNKEKHVVLLDVVPAAEQEFFTALREQVLKTRRKETLVFIHGYQNSFEYAARRTAQIAYDLNFDGVPILYSWPSEAKFLNYKADEGNVEWTTPRLEAFLTAVGQRSGAERIYLIAHSMGNRALTRSLNTLAARQQTWVREKIRELILAAPDIDASVFRDLAVEFSKVAGRTTLYVSSKDKALKLSEKLSHYLRAGQTGENILIIPGIETVDVSAVDTSFTGHSYFGSNRSVLSDIFRLLQSGQSAQARCGLSAEQIARGTYWKFRKDLASNCPMPK